VASLAVRPSLCSSSRARLLEFHAVPAALSATNELFSGERRLTMAERTHAHSLPPDRVCAR